MIDTRLLNAIVCPKCLNSLQYDQEKKQLVCLSDRLIFLINDGIPVLIESEALLAAD